MCPVIPMLLVRCPGDHNLTSLWSNSLTPILGRVIYEPRGGFGSGTPSPPRNLSSLRGAVQLEEPVSDTSGAANGCDWPFKHWCQWRVLLGFHTSGGWLRHRKCGHPVNI